MMFRSMLRSLLMCSSLLMLTATGVSQANTKLFELEGKAYGTADLSKSLQQALYEIESGYFEQMSQLADALVLERYLQQEASKQKLDLAAIEAKLLAPKTPTEAEMKAFYEAQKAMINQPYDAIKSQLEQFLKQRSVEEKRQALLQEIKTKSQFKLLLPEPQAPQLSIRTEGYPFLGEAKAKVEMVVFADYQCPHCKEEMQQLRPLLEKYGKQVKLVYRDFPINRSGVSTTVAHGAECASQQGKFWDYNEMAFELQEGLSKDSPKDIAEILELDLNAFQSCMSKPETAARVADSKKEAEALHITGTPTLFINGRLRKVNHHIPHALEDEIKRQIQANP